MYRREAFAEGLKAAGYEVTHRAPDNVAPGDVLVIWNRYGDNDHHANRVEGAGGTVIVAENGYLDPGRHAGNGGDRRWYALAVGGHNGQGQWMDGGPSRWAKIAPQLGAEIKPWRPHDDGERGHILVCPNRSFGRPGRVMPANWAYEAVRQLRNVTSRSLRVRPHPGNDAPRVPLSDDLAGCWAMMIWASSAGVHALLAGIPVICSSPWWICKTDFFGWKEIEGGKLPDRQPLFERLAWAQWHVEEIARGEPFRHLLSPARESESATPV